MHNLNIAFDAVSYTFGNPLFRVSKAKVAAAIINTLKQKPLDLIKGFRQGTKIIDTFKRVYGITGISYRRQIWLQFNGLHYDGTDFIIFTAK